MSKIIKYIFYISTTICISYNLCSEMTVSLTAITLASFALVLALPGINNITYYMINKQT